MLILNWIVQGQGAAYEEDGAHADEIMDIWFSRPRGNIS